jgi:hypothetical protein
VGTAGAIAQGDCALNRREPELAHILSEIAIDLHGDIRPRQLQPGGLDVECAVTRVDMQQARQQRIAFRVEPEGGFDGADVVCKVHQPGDILASQDQGPFGVHRTVPPAERLVICRSL